LDTQAYDEASEEVMTLLRDFGHPVEVWGWDEAYVGADLNDSDDPIKLAEQIREVVTGDRSVDALWGVGPKTAKKLAGLGITTVADLAATDATLLTSTFGPTTGLWILLLAKGGGDTNVSAEPWIPRSRSH